MDTREPPTSSHARVRQDVPMSNSEALSRIEAELGLLLRRARASAERLSREVHHDLEPSAYPLLVRIEREPDVRASELADLIGVGRGTMSRQLAKIEQLGLIERRPDPEDSRGQLIRVTAEGAQRVDDARQARRALLGQALAGWDEAERSVLADQLDRLNVDLARITAPGAPTRPLR
jgi:DNA-binding MarR family transcriptional regulator